MFIKLQNKYVRMDRIESVYVQDTHLYVHTLSGKFYSRPLRDNEEPDKLVTAIVQRIVQLDIERNMPHAKVHN